MSRALAILAVCALVPLALVPAAAASGGKGDGASAQNSKGGGGGSKGSSQKGSGGSTSSSAESSSKGGASSSTSSKGKGGSSSSSSSTGGSSSGGSSSSSGSSSGSFLVSPSLGLMIWTLALFLFTMYVLSRTAFPRISAALQKRANAIREAIDDAEKQRAGANELLQEYRERLREAREQADDIMTRARKAAEAVQAEAAAAGKEKREELVAAARRDIEIETRRSLERIRKEVADLTVIATEKLTRKTLDAKDHERLIQEALAEADFSALASGTAGNGAREESESEEAKA